MPSETAKRIDAIVNDAACDKGEKVKRLRQLEADALARQRASTEGMGTSDAREGDDLKQIEQALLALGEASADPGPATI